MSATPWLDVSLPISEKSVAWDGLPTRRLEWLASIQENASVNVAALDCCLHTGTHADAPLHVNADGVAVEGLKPEIFVGPAMVVRTVSFESISKAELASLGLEARSVGHAIERVLIATPAQYDGCQTKEKQTIHRITDPSPA